MQIPLPHQPAIHLFLFHCPRLPSTFQLRTHKQFPRVFSSIRALRWNQPFIRGRPPLPTVISLPSPPRRLRWMRASKFLWGAFFFIFFFFAYRVTLLGSSPARTRSTSTSPCPTERALSRRLPTACRSTSCLSPFF